MELSTFSLFLTGFQYNFIPLTLVWILSVILKRVDIVDSYWSLCFVVLNFAYMVSSQTEFNISTLNPKAILVTFFVLLWAFRLSGYLVWRTFKHSEEDLRYQKFRAFYNKKGLNYTWFSFFQVFMLQGIIASIISLPLTYVQRSTQIEYTIFDYIAIPLFLLGFFFESVADFQMAIFKSNEENKGTVLDTGLFRYSRHPNYFGNAVIWWSFFLFALGSNVPGAIYSIFSAIFMNYLLLNVSGVSMLEKNLKRSKPQYEDYIKTTSSFIPMFPKKTKTM